MIIVGVILAILAAVLGTTSKQLIAASEHYHTKWMFFLGALLNMVVGPVVDALSYLFAPQVIVAPLACLDVILNALTARWTLRWEGEVLTKAHCVGVLLVTLGAIGTSLAAEASERKWTVYDLEDQLLRVESLVFLSCELVVAVTALVLLRCKIFHSVLRGLTLGVTAGLLMGNVFLAKGTLAILSATIETGESAAWKRATPYLLALFAVAGPVCGQFFMKKGLAEYKGVYMVTIFQGSHITIACLSGWVVMEEMTDAVWWRIVVYWCSVALIIGGLLAINTAAVDSTLRRSSYGIVAELDWRQAVNRAASAVLAASHATSAMFFASPRKAAAAPTDDEHETEPREEGSAAVPGGHGPGPVESV